MNIPYFVVGCWIVKGCWLPDNYACSFLSTFKKRQNIKQNFSYLRE